MSKNEEKEREHSKSPQEKNKLTEINKKRESNEEYSLREERDPDGISKMFPNFSALTGTERFVFFETLATARRNVEKRGIPTRQCFNTVHDEYLKLFTPDQKEGKEVLENAKETSCPKSNLVIRDDNISSCINKLTFNIDSLNVPSEKFRSWTSKSRVTNKKSNNKLITNEADPWDHCESVIQNNTREVIDLYLKKKKRNETKFNNVQLICEKPVKSEGNKISELLDEKIPDGGRTKTESLRTCTMAKPTLKVRNTSKFDALNAEEKEIFFRTLRKAHDSVIEKNPVKEILALNVVMKRYQAYCQSTAVFGIFQELLRGEDGWRNLRKKVILTSRDNERLSSAKSQVFFDATSESSYRTHKSADSFHVKVKEPSKPDEIPNQADLSESSFCNVGKASKDSLEINETNISKLKRQKKTKKFKKMKKKEKPTQKREKKKTKRKEKKSSFKKLITAFIPKYEPKNPDSLEINNIDLPVTARKKEVKGIKKEFQVQKKRLLKNKMEKIKVEQKKENMQKKEELVFELKYLLSWGNVENHLNTKAESLKLLKERFQVEAKECQTRDSKEIHEDREKETSMDVNGSEGNCEKSWRKLKSEQNEKRKIGKGDETINEEEKLEVECIIACEGRKEKEIKTPVTFEQKEEKTSEINSVLLTSVAIEDVVLFDSYLSAKEDSTTPVKSLVLNSDNNCNNEKMKTLLESSQKNPKPLIVGIQNEITNKTTVLQEVFKETSFLKKSLGENEIKETQFDCAVSKVMLVDVKNLIFYLKAKIQKDNHSENECLQLLVDYFDCLSKVLESLVLGEKERHPKQVEESFTAAEVRLKVDETSARNQEKGNALHAKKVFIPRSVSDQDWNSTKFNLNSAGPIAETTAEKPKENPSEEGTSPAMELRSRSNFEAEVCFSPNNAGDKKLLQDHHQRADLVERGIAVLNVVHHPEAENFISKKKPSTDEDEENTQQNHKIKFFKILLKCCFCGKKNTEDDGTFENLNERPSELTRKTRRPP